MQKVFNDKFNVTLKNFTDVMTNLVTLLRY